MKILGYIPARSGSKGVPDKNIKQLNGVPLLEFSVFSAVRAKQFGFLDQVMVSTDSPEYLSFVDGYDISQGYLRPEEFSTDKSPTIDGILHALEWYKKEHDIFFDAVMTLQPTSPFRTPEHIEKALQLMKSNQQATCVASVSLLGDYHPLRIKRLEDGGRLLDFYDEHVEPDPSRRQDFEPSAYIRNGAIYLTKIKTLLEDGLIRGPWILGMEMPEGNSINVDEHMDFLIAKASLEYEGYKDQLSFFNELFKKKDKR